MYDVGIRFSRNTAVYYRGWKRKKPLLLERFGSGVDATTDAATIFAIISTVAGRERERERTRIRAWNLKRSVARVVAWRNAGTITSHGVTRIPINPNAPSPPVYRAQPHASTPVPEEACTTPLPEISINL